MWNLPNVNDEDTEKVCKICSQPLWQLRESQRKYNLFKNVKKDTRITSTFVQSKQKRQETNGTQTNAPEENCLRLGLGLWYDKG